MLLGYLLVSLDHESLPLPLNSGMLLDWCCYPPDFLEYLSGLCHSSHGNYSRPLVMVMELLALLRRWREASSRDPYLRSFFPQIQVILGAARLHWDYTGSGMLIEMREAMSQLL